MVDLTIIANPHAAHQAAHQAALAEGAKAYGLTVSLQSSGVPVRSKHVACWGWRLGRAYRAAGHEVLVMERGYMGDRFAWTSIGWNGLNNRAQFGIRNDGGARFRQHFADLLQPWNPAGRYVLLIGQVPGDMSLQGRNLAPWYAEQAKAAGERYGLPVLFRPHPMALQRGYAATVPFAAELLGDLSAALRDAAAVITFNSNTGVDALLAGKPTVAHDPGSMVWGFTGDGDAEPDRLRWAHRLAWCQWTLDEIRSGEAVETVFSLSPLQRAA